MIVLTLWPLAMFGSGGFVIVAVTYECACTHHAAFEGMELYLFYLLFILQILNSLGR